MATDYTDTEMLPATIEKAREEGRREGHTAACLEIAGRLNGSLPDIHGVWPRYPAGDARKHGWFDAEEAWADAVRALGETGSWPEEAED